MKYLRSKIEAVMMSQSEHSSALFWERFLYLVSRFYGAGLSIRRKLFHARILKVRSLPCQVISIGNLTVGGTGKTPLTIYVADLLRGLGCRVAVISRGYQGRKEKVGGIVSDGRNMRMGPADAGDEPYLMSLKLDGIPVLVGRDRYRVGKLAIRTFSPDIIVLDDAFQHVQIDRDLDLLLLDATRPFGNGHLLPRGVLREPLDQAVRSDAVILTRSYNGMSSCDQKYFDALSKDKSVFRCQHVPDKLLGSKSLPWVAHGYRPDTYGLNTLRGKRVFAFSGIAGNEDFVAMVKNQGCQITGTCRFPDHHIYTDSELANIYDQAKQQHVDYMVTTEKDYVRIAHRITWPVTLMALGIRIDFGDDTERFSGYFGKQLLEPKF